MADADTSSRSAVAPPGGGPAARVTSVDALRGLVMFAMIFVNDITDRSEAAQDSIPAWLKHFDRTRSGMTFVDVVFPAFLFLVGMSIPFALGSRIKKGEAIWKILLHIAARTLSLLMIGVLMVNAPSSQAMGWSASGWSALMFICSILAFCSVAKMGGKKVAIAGLVLRAIGFVGLAVLAMIFKGEGGRRMVTLWPVDIHTSWFGILGLIGWAYLVAAIVFLCFRGHRTALVGCVAVLMCLYPAGRSGVFGKCWFATHVNIGTMLGSQAAISVAGVLLASILLSPEMDGVWRRTRFTLLFVGGCVLAGLLLQRQWDVNKIAATPSWCFWSCAITAALWLIFYFLCDVLPTRWLMKPFSIAGQNVLLAYLLYNLIDPMLDLLGVDAWYERLAEASLAHAVERSIICAVVILAITALLNRLGFRLRL